MPKPLSSAPGSADIDKQGHTTTEQYGHVVDAKPAKRVKPRDLNLK